MENIYILLADGFEEIEALVPTDILRRAGFNVVLVATTRSRKITGSHGISVAADILFNEIDHNNTLMLILPGGTPGIFNLKTNSRLVNLVRRHVYQEKWIGAICAAPIILGELGLLKGKLVTCYPGYEKLLLGASIINTPVVTDGKIITARSAGAALEFSLEIVTQLLGKSKTNDLRENLIMKS